jgi:hypothetical protein
MARPARWMEAGIRQSESTVWYLAQADHGTQLSAQMKNQRIDVDFSDLLIENRLHGEVVPEIAVRLQMSEMPTFRPSGKSPLVFSEH